MNDYVYNNTLVTVPIDVGDMNLEMGKAYTWNVILCDNFEDDEENIETYGFASNKYYFKTAYNPIISDTSDYIASEILSEQEGSFFVNDSEFYYDIKEENPILQIGTIQNRILNFEGYYVSNELVSDCKYYYCRLIAEDGEVVDETDKIFSARIAYSFNGLISNKQYTLEVYVVSQTDQYLHLTIEFLVFYNMGANLGYAPELNCNLEDNSIDIKWVKDYTAIAKTTGEYEISQNQVDIQSGEIIYDEIANQPLGTYKDFTIAFKSTINNNTTKILTYINDNIIYEIYMENYKLYLKYGAQENIVELGNFTEEIVFGIQDYSSPKDDTGYMWLDNETFDDNTEQFLLVTKEQSRKFSFILSRINNIVNCQAEEVTTSE